MTKKLISRKQAAQQLGVSTRTLMNYEKRGLIQKMSVLPGSRVRYHEETIKNLFKIAQSN